MAISSANSVGAVIYHNAAFYKGKKNNGMNESVHPESKMEQHQNVNEMKRMMTGTDKNKNKPQSVVDQTLKYGESIRASRNKTKDTSTQLKKLKYNFKDISGQIRKSKTSVNAKQVASKARREVVQLKMKMQTGKYDNEELEAAITHAKAMERAAKKKARHLEEEELIKITENSNGTAAAFSELESEMEEKIEAEELELEESMEEAQEIMEESMEEAIEQATEDMYDMLSDSMEELMEETLGDLAESMMAMTDYEMTEDEFTAFKLKHRSSEEKSMLEADAKYLKAMFDMYDRKLNGAGGGIQGMSSIYADMSGVTFSGSESMPIPNAVDVLV